MKGRVTLTRPPESRRRRAPLPTIELAPARILLPTPREQVLVPDRPSRGCPELGAAPAPREGLGPEGQADWLLGLLILIPIYVALEVSRWL